MPRYKTPTLLSTDPRAINHNLTPKSKFQPPPSLHNAVYSPYYPLGSCVSHLSLHIPPSIDSNINNLARPRLPYPPPSLKLCNCSREMRSRQSLPRSSQRRILQLVRPNVLISRDVTGRIERGSALIEDVGEDLNDLQLCRILNFLNGNLCFY